jgi:hypothetical protein
VPLFGRALFARRLESQAGVDAFAVTLYIAVWASPWLFGPLASFS